MIDYGIIIKEMHDAMQFWRRSPNFSCGKVFLTTTTVVIDHERRKMDFPSKI